jgi:cyanophycinase
MSGPIVLVGAGEFTPAMAGVDRALLASTGMARPRVAIVPTASWPDGEATFARWGAMGEAHFAALGAEVEQVLVRGQADADDPTCAQAVGEADLIYFSGGKPRHLRDVLRGSALWAAALAAHERGAILAGCSAGAMVLGERQLDVGRGLRPPVGWDPALGVVPSVAVIPHYDRVPHTLAALMVMTAPRGTVVLGIDEDTAAVGEGGAFRVIGRASVEVWRGRDRRRYRDGESFTV